MTYDEFKKRYRYEPTNDLLGEGAFGKVFRATDTESGSTVAIKVAPSIQPMKAILSNTNLKQ
ncbi:MAG: hypothetical protein R2822_27165 [Spirosomataceae bacterium]